MLEQELEQALESDGAYQALEHLDSVVAHETSAFAVEASAFVVEASASAGAVAMAENQVLEQHHLPHSKR